MNQKFSSVIWILQLYLEMRTRLPTYSFRDQTERSSKLGLFIWTLMINGSGPGPCMDDQTVSQSKSHTLTHHYPPP